MPHEHKHKPKPADQSDNKAPSSPPLLNAYIARTTVTLPPPRPKYNSNKPTPNQLPPPPPLTKTQKRKKNTYKLYRPEYLCHLFPQWCWLYNRSLRRSSLPSSADERTICHHAGWWLGTSSTASAKKRFPAIHRHSVRRGRHPTPFGNCGRCGGRYCWLGGKDRGWRGKGKGYGGGRWGANRVEEGRNEGRGQRGKGEYRNRGKGVRECDVWEAKEERRRMKDMTRVGNGGERRRVGVGRGYSSSLAFQASRTTAGVRYEKEGEEEKDKEGNKKKGWKEKAGKRRAVVRSGKGGGGGGEVVDEEEEDMEKKKGGKRGLWYIDRPAEGVRTSERGVKLGGRREEMTMACRDDEEILWSQEGKKVRLGDVREGEGPQYSVRWVVGGGGKQKGRNRGLVRCDNGEEFSSPEQAKVESDWDGSEWEDIDADDLTSDHEAWEHVISECSEYCFTYQL